MTITWFIKNPSILINNEFGIGQILISICFVRKIIDNKKNGLLNFALNYFYDIEESLQCIALISIA